MSQPFAQLTMPASSNWRANVRGLGHVGALAIAAMMLPSALPMILDLVNLCVRTRERTRGISFVAAYLIVCSSSARGDGRTVGAAMNWVN
jgi:predicted metal-binding membrane protein